MDEFGWLAVITGTISALVVAIGQVLTLWSQYQAKTLALNTYYLVNGQRLELLKQVAVALRRVSDVTGEPGDRIAADQAELRVAEHQGRITPPPGVSGLHSPVPPPPASHGR